MIDLKLLLIISIILFVAYGSYDFYRYITKTRKKDIAEGNKPTSYWRFIGELFFVVSFVGLGLWGLITLASLAGLGGVMYHIEKHQFKNHVLHFSIPDRDNFYAVSIPPYIDIKPTDKIDVLLWIDRGKVENIKGVYVNEKPVHDGSYQLIYTETVNRY